MRILITNDDGIAAPGLAIMREIARALSDDVWVVAPDGNQSGAGHRFTLAREMTFEEHEPKVFSVVGGSPADCVVVGATHLLGDHPPDVVLSGGCFQNALLTARVQEKLAGAGFRVHRHHAFPPNDGGISLGQAAVAGLTTAGR